MANIYHIKMDAKQPQTTSFSLDLTQSQVNRLRTYVDGKQTDTIQELVLKLLKKTSNINYQKKTNAR
jgi:hypothetical protein